jgi:hypothetical protein
MACFSFKPHDIYIYEKYVIRIDCVSILLTRTNVMSLCSSLYFIIDKINMFQLIKTYKWNCNDVTDVYVSNKREGKRHHTTGTIDSYALQIHDHSLSWFGTDATVKGVWGKLVLLGQTSPLTKMGGGGGRGHASKWCPHISAFYN